MSCLRRLALSDRSLFIPCRVVNEREFVRENGVIILGDSLKYLATLKPESVDLIVTSPPFGLVRKKVYGNVYANEYLEWFRPFGGWRIRAALWHVCDHGAPHCRSRGASEFQPG